MVVGVSTEAAFSMRSPWPNDVHKSSQIPFCIVKKPGRVHAAFCGNYHGNEKIGQWEMAEQSDG